MEKIRDTGPATVDNSPLRDHGKRDFSGGKTMKLGAVVSALTIATAGPAAADVVVWKESGLSSAFGYISPLPFEMEAGRYRLEFTASQTLEYTIGYFYDNHYHYYGPDGYIFGNSYTISASENRVGNSDSYEFEIPSAFTEYWGDYYQENHPENIGPLLSSWFTDESFEYTVRLTLLSAVPEPTTWVIMIAGFGLVGSTLRRRHRILTAREIAQIGS